MLNEVIEIAKNMGILEAIGKEKTHKFIEEIVNIGSQYDCNNGEILENIGEEFGICYACLEETEDMEYGICKKCRD
jgi:hypothetical protein